MLFISLARKHIFVSHRIPYFGNYVIDMQKGSENENALHESQITQQ